MAKLDQQTTPQDIRHDYEHLARLANLRYVSDDEPGFTRCLLYTSPSPRDRG